MMFNHQVRKVNPRAVDGFLQRHHYKKGVGAFGYFYACHEGDTLVGVMQLSQASRQIQMHGFTEPVMVLEITRLALVPRHHPELGSWFIAQVLKMLPRPCAVVSFADTAQNHIGYIYQAANFWYAGLTKPSGTRYGIGAFEIQERSVYNYGVTNPRKWADELGLTTIPPSSKHKYWYFMGSHREVRWFRNNIKGTLTRAYPKVVA